MQLQIQTGVKYKLSQQMLVLLCSDFIGSLHGLFEWLATSYINE